MIFTTPNGPDIKSGPCCDPEFHKHLEQDTRTPYWLRPTDGISSNKFDQFNKVVEPLKLGMSFIPEINQSFYLNIKNIMPNPFQGFGCFYKDIQSFKKRSLEWSIKEPFGFNSDNDDLLKKLPFDNSKENKKTLEDRSLKNPGLRDFDPSFMKLIFN